MSQPHSTAFKQIVDQHQEIITKLGSLIYWLGLIDHHMARNLAHFAEVENFEVFQKILGQTPPRDIANRVRNIAKYLNRLGPNVEKRLVILQSITDKRNNLVHHALYLKEERIYFYNLGKSPHRIFGRHNPNNEKAGSYGLEELECDVVWLKEFFDDLLECSASTYRKGVFEVNSPRSWAPHPRPDAPSTPTTTRRKPSKTRA